MTTRINTFRVDGGDMAKGAMEYGEARDIGTLGKITIDKG